MNHADTTTPTDQDRLPAPAEEPGFDDGLVHDHGWACGERSTPAH